MMTNADMNGFDMQQINALRVGVDSQSAIDAIRAAQVRIAAERGWCEGEDLRNWDALHTVMQAIRERDALIDELRKMAVAAANLSALLPVLLEAQTLLVNIETGAQISLRESEVRREWVQQIANWPYLKSWFRRCAEAVAGARAHHTAAAVADKKINAQAIRVNGEVSA
ncbi:hypothetical protein WK28_24290 [Burkholderia vietnamiensis]|nr:hypothetical protein WK28_24290 [Burkholderia vietnamiensis]